jgi:hypothetical protein
MYLIVEPLPSVKIGMMDSLSPSAVDWHGDHYTGVTLPDDSPVFYDWVRDDLGRIVGVDLYIWREHADLLGDLCSALAEHINGALRVMFVPDAVGSPDGTQGFGDIFFYRCSTDRWLIAIETKSWLKSGDTQRLEQIAHMEH